MSCGLMAHLPHARTRRRGDLNTTRVSDRQWRALDEARRSRLEIVARDGARNEPPSTRVVVAGSSASSMTIAPSAADGSITSTPPDASLRRSSLSRRLDAYIDEARPRAECAPVPLIGATITVTLASPSSSARSALVGETTPPSTSSRSPIATGRMTPGTAHDAATASARLTRCRVRRRRGRRWRCRRSRPTAVHRMARRDPG